MAEDFGGDYKTDTGGGGGGKSGEDYIRAIMAANLTIPEDILCRVFKVSQERVNKMQDELRRATLTSSSPLSWDYVMAFDAGSDQVIHKPTNKELKNKASNAGYDDEWTNGMTQRKYYSQIILQTQKELEHAYLSTKLFKSANEKFVFLIVGITEENLKRWADQRDTDLEIDPIPACKEGRRREFPLALRTLADETQDDKSKCTLPLDNWKSMYCQYNPRAEKSIYKHYQRIRGDSSVMTLFDEKTRLRIIYETMIEDKGEGGAEIEIQAHIQSPNHPMKACFPLHDPVRLDELSQKWVLNWNIKDCMTVPLEDIREYFGEPTAFYYAFMMFYLRWLIWPTIIGVIFFIAQLGYGKIDLPGLFILSLFIIFWCVAFVDFWIRTESRYRVLWGMTKFETKAVARPEFKGEWQYDRVSGLWTEDYSFIYRLFKGTFVFSGLGVWMGGCVVAVVYVLLLRDADPTDTGLKIGLGVLNGVMIAIFDRIYQYGSKYGNEWENHRTEQDFQDALIAKSFIFKFFNSFSSLFYLTFIRPFVKGNDYYIRNYTNVCSSCKGDAESDYAPLCKTDSSEIKDSDYSCCYDSTYDYSCTKTEVQNQINSQVLDDLRLQLASLFVTAIVIQNMLEVLVPYFMGRLNETLEKRDAASRGESIHSKSDAEEQMLLTPNQNTIDDMSEMAIQFGYVTMFVIALPITPLFSLINNIIELKVDGYKMVNESQRPHANGSSGLGAWNGVLGFFSVVAVGTNVALITWRTQLVNILISTEPTMKWVFFTFVSILLGLLVGAEKWAIPDVPVEVLQAIERQRLIENVLVLGAHIDMDGDEAPKKEDDIAEFAFDPTKQAIDLSQLPFIPLGDLTQLQEKSTSGP